LRMKAARKADADDRAQRKHWLDFASGMDSEDLSALGAGGYMGHAGEEDKGAKTRTEVLKKRAAQRAQHFSNDGGDFIQESGDGDDGETEAKGDSPRQRLRTRSSNDSSGHYSSID
jgi:hypothetical protein